MPEFIDVDPGELYLPPSRAQGADPGKLARQIARHGSSLAGMPPIQVVRGKDGDLRINDGVTRATRAAKLRPGETIPAAPMTEKDREDLLSAVAELGRRYPNWRLGQLIANVAGWADQEVWDIEDDQLLAAARSHLEQAVLRDAVR
jgi:hypothetical protein